MTIPVHVAVAVIVNAEKQVLLALRHAHQHQGSLWEFPGGKVEAGESVFDALVRETKEELAVTILAAKPLTKIAHDYSDKSVLLDVWTVDEFVGTPHGCEGQSLRWCNIADLIDDDFPAANAEIIKALRQE
ncbi:MAG: 8-oxo-dGTP diphosphatase MutT [Gammaproteobacteria bacterium]|nr:8-oxo-dGTP diphosphatase MutT [Gammaproteobacteria bacterium]